MAGSAVSQQALVAAVEAVTPGIEWTFIGVTVGTTDLTYDASKQAGDIGFYINNAINTDGSTPSTVTPTLHTVLLNATGSGDISRAERLMVSAKILDGTEGAITGMNGLTEFTIGIVLRPSIPIASFANAVAWDEDIQNGNPGARSITIDTETEALVVIGVAAGEDNPPSFSAATPAFGAEQPTGGGITGLTAGWTLYDKGATISNQSCDVGDMGNISGVALGAIEVIAA